MIGLATTEKITDSRQDNYRLPNILHLLGLRLDFSPAYTMPEFRRLRTYVYYVLSNRK